MKKSLFITFITALMMSVGLLTVHADTNTTEITGYVVKSDIQAKTITVKNDNQQDFTIENMPTQYLGYDKSKGKVTVKATTTNNSLTFDSLTINNKVKATHKTNHKNSDNYLNCIGNNMPFLLMTGLFIFTILFVLAGYTFVYHYTQNRFFLSFGFGFIIACVVLGLFMLFRLI